MDSDAGSWPGVLDAGAALLDHAGELVPRYEREPHLGQDAAADPKVVVAEPRAVHPEHHLVGRGAGVGAVGKPVLTRRGRVKGPHQEPLRVSKCRFCPSLIAMQSFCASASSL